MTNYNKNANIKNHHFFENIIPVKCFLTFLAAKATINQTMVQQNYRRKNDIEYRKRN